MPKVDLGSTTNLMAAPVQTKGHARDVKPFAKVLSSLDAAGRRGQTSAEFIVESVETITNGQPSPPAEGAGRVESRAVDAGDKEAPAQDEPMEAQETAPSSAQSPDEATERPDPAVESVPADSKNVRTLDHGDVAIGEGGAQVQLAAQTNPTAVSVSARVAGEPQLAQQDPQPAQSRPAEAERAVKDVADEPADAQHTSSTSKLGQSCQGNQAASPAPRARASTATTTAVNDPSPAQTPAIDGRRPTGVLNDAFSDAPDLKLAPAPQQTLEASIVPMGQAEDAKPSEPLTMRPAVRTRAANSPVIRPVFKPTQTPAPELSPAQPHADVVPAAEQVKPDNQLPLDDHRQDTNQKASPDPLHAPAALHHPASPTPVPVGQQAAAPVQPAPASGNSQKVGASSTIGSIAAPLSGAQIKQIALDRLTAQAPLLKHGIEQASFIPQAAKGLAMALKQSDGTITLKLTPGHLGAIKIEVTLQGTEVAARLEPSTESARQLLIDSQSSLRAALEARGLSVERIEVTAPQSAPAQDARDQRNPGHYQDQPGAGFAGQGDAGRHTGRDAESFPGQQGGAIGHRFEASGGSDEPPPTTQGSTVTLTLDNGGTYRLHLDAVA